MAEKRRFVSAEENKATLRRYVEEGKVMVSWDNLDQLGAIAEPG